MGAMFEEAQSTGIHENVVRILSSRGGLAGKVVIDLACGDGRTTHLLRSLGAIVRPFDILPDRYKLEDAATFADAGDALPIETGSADIVVLQEVIEHLPNQLFALQEIARILKPDGELFLTTPNRSALVAKLAFTCFESENLRGTPASPYESVWGTDATGLKKYYGHLFLIGIQQLRTLALIAGFRSMKVLRSDASTSSLWLMLPLYPLVLVASLLALGRFYRKERDAVKRREKLAQFRLNVDPVGLTSKYMIVVLRK